jgi:hypothetical protein
MPARPNPGNATPASITDFDAARDGICERAMVEEMRERLRDALSKSPRFGSVIGYQPGAREVRSRRLSGP